MPNRRILDDLARVADGAASTFQGLREEVETIVRGRVERIVTDLDLVTRDEFEAVRTMAMRAREENEDLKQKLAALEAKLSEGAETP